MTPESLEDIAGKRRDRCLAAILSVRDEVSPHLPEELGRKLRKVILDQVNDLTETLVDLMKAVNDDSVLVNEYFLERHFMEVRELIREVASDA